MFGAPGRVAAHTELESTAPAAGSTVFAATVLDAGGSSRRVLIRWVRAAGMLAASTT